VSGAAKVAGAKVDAVASVRAALGALDGLRPDVLISDIGMPGEDGYALIHHIRKRDAAHGGHMPAIALTGYASSEDRARLLAAGFQAHSRKPLEPSNIVAAVASLAPRGYTRAAAS
jgi:CheY-like chemotaxis protein